MTDAASSNLRPTRELPGSLDASAPVGRLLEQTTVEFEAIRMSLARRWAETLIAAVLDVPHEELMAHAGRTLNPEQRRRFEGIARQASPDAPLAYAIGRAPFMDLDFEVSPDTLIPKVDTELFVGAMLDELARRYSDAEQDRIDGLTVSYADWWFNCRPSNTEPLLRLNLEANSEELMRRKRDEVLAIIRGGG